MKFGTHYAYWGNEWKCDYIQTVNRAADIGFDLLEIGADHLYHMEKSDILKLKNEGEKRGICFSVNSGPSPEYDLASTDSGIRKQGINYFLKILHNKKEQGSDTLIGALCSYWPTNFFISDLDKKGAWERSIHCIKEIGKTAEDLNIYCSIEVLNRNESFILTNCKEALEYINLIGSKHVNILLDTYHMNIEEDDMFEAIRNAGNALGHFHAGECNRKLPGMNNTINWPEVGKALRDIHYNKAVVMEPFLLTGGAVGRDMRVWRPMVSNTSQSQLDKYITDSLSFLKLCFNGME